MEYGGPQGAVVLFDVQAVDGKLFDVLASNGKVLVTAMIDDFVNGKLKGDLIAQPGPMRRECFWLCKKCLTSNELAPRGAEGPCPQACGSRQRRRRREQCRHGS